MATAKHGTLKQSFIDSGLPEVLVTALLAEYEENKRRYFLHDYRPAAVNGGRFCEVVARILQFQGNGQQHVPLDQEIKVDRALTKIENDMTLDEGCRLHIPRAIRMIYGIRNKRDTGHIKGGLDPLLQDATLVVGVVDWILAELVRLSHGVSAVQAQELIAGIVTKEIPLVAEYNDRPVLMADLKHVDHVLVVLYWANREAVTRAELRAWLPARIAQSLSRTLITAEKAHYVHLDGDQIFLTLSGKRHVEDVGLLQPV